MIAEGVLVDTSQAQMVQQQQHQQQMQQQNVQMQQQTAMAPPPMQSGPMQSGPMQSGPMNDSQMHTNGTTRKPGRMNSGDGCCDNARERAKDAVAKVAPCACKLHICIASLNISIFIYILELFYKNLEK